MEHLTRVFNSDDAIAGSWWQDVMFDGSKGCVSIKCPQCGKSATLRDGEDWPTRRDGTHGHDIDKNGNVTPSVVCPHKPCTWHTYVTLDDWEF
jgi:hypothetical protein